MRPLAPVLALLSLLPLASCSVGGPNGKKGVLFIYPAFNQGPMSRYLEQSFIIPRQSTMGEQYGPSRTWTYDFAFTTLEVSGPGIESPSASLGGDGWHLSFRCMTPPGQPTEVTVRVMDGTWVRYADAFDVTCYEPETVQAYRYITHFDGFLIPKAVVLGGDWEMYASAAGTVGGALSSLQGSGIGLSDAGLMSVVSRSYTGSHLGDDLVLRAERLGRDPVLVAGSAQTAVEMEVVPDDAWVLKVWAQYNLNRTLSFAGYPELADGGVALGLRDACVFHFSNDAGIQVDEHDCEGSGNNQPDTGTVCVDAFGRSACGSW